MYISLSNEEKAIEIDMPQGRFARYPIRTPVIKPGDDMAAVLAAAIQNRLEKTDILFVSEKSVACAQGRAIPVKEIHPRALAAFLSKFVHKTSHGIGLSMPETMEVALRECGVIRILIASAAGAVGRILGRKGWFYHIAGRNAAAIDGPCPYTISPYNHYVVPAPLKPDTVCRELSYELGCSVAIVDINDLGGKVLGVYPDTLDKKFIVKALRDNPLGQGSEHTPAGILRRVGGK